MIKVTLPRPYETSASCISLLQLSVYHSFLLLLLFLFNLGLLRSAKSNLMIFSLSYSCFFVLPVVFIISLCSFFLYFVQTVPVCLLSSSLKQLNSLILIFLSHTSSLALIFGLAQLRFGHSVSVNEIVSSVIVSNYGLLFQIVRSHSLCTICGLTICPIRRSQFTNAFNNGTIIFL